VLTVVEMVGGVEARPVLASGLGQSSHTGLG
jgi:hypothetical protein